MRAYYFYKPFAYLFLFLIVEKVLLIPVVRDRFTMASGIDFDVHAIEGEEELSRKDQKQIWVFGTSRSVAFARAPTVLDISEAPELSNEQRQQLARYRIYSFSMFAAVPAVYLHHYLYLRERGYRPDLVWIEVSAFAFNKNYSLRNNFIAEVSPDAFILQHLNQYPPRFLQEWLMSRLFVGSVFPPVLRDERTRSLHEALNPLSYSGISLNRPTSRTTEREKDRSITEFPDMSSSPEYRLMLQYIYGEGFLRDYAVDRTAVDSLEFLIAELEREGIPFVLWTPPVHPSMTQLEREYGVDEPFVSVVDHLKRSHRPYIHVKADEMNCRLFSDESHLAEICFAELAARLLSFSYYRQSP